MFSTKLAYRNIPRRKARSILTCSAIVLGVALLVGINMATASAMGEFTGYINRFWGETDIVVRYASVTPFSTQYTSIVRSTDGISATAQRLNRPGSIGNTTGVQIVGIDSATDFDYATFNIDGDKSLSTGKAVVSATLARKLSLSIGSDFRVDTTDSIGHSTLFQLSVIGIDHPSRNVIPTVYASLSEVQMGLGLNGMITHVYAKTTDPAGVVAIRDRLQSILGAFFDVTAPKAEAVARINGQMAGFQLGLNIMVLVALVVCSFIVFNTLFMTVTERTYEIGVMRAVGTSRQQIFRIFLIEGLLLGGIGTVVGVAAGVGLSRFFTTVFERLGFPSLPTVVLTRDLAITGVLAGLLAVLAGSFYPALRASRADIIQAIRPILQGREKKGRFAATSMIGGIMLGTGTVQALRLSEYHVSYLDVVLIPLGTIILGAVLYNRQGRIVSILLSPLSRAVASVASRSGRRRLVRNTVSFGMITITLSFVIMIGGIQYGVQASVEQGIREALGADIILVANQSVPVSFAHELALGPMVEQATPLSPSLTSTRAVGPKQDSTIGILAVDPDQFPRIVSYNFISPTNPEEAYQQLKTNNQTLLIPDSLSSKLGVSKGDKLTVFTTKNQTDFTVAGVFTGAVLQYVRFGDSYASDSILVSLNSQNYYFNGKYESPVFLVNLKPAFKADTAGVARDLASLYPKYNLAENSITLDQLLALVRTTIDKVFAIILLILYFAIIIATLGIGATMIMSVAERRREIGLLRSQGMSSRQIIGLFLGEGVILGLYGFLLAVPSGLLLLKGATTSTTIQGFWLPFIIPWNAIEQSLVLALIAVVVGSLYPAVKASRIEITKALHYT